MSVTLNKSYLSLQRGTMYQLIADAPVTWSTSNPNVRVSQNGVVYADRVDRLRPDGQTTIMATAEDSSSATCQVTIVNWSANKVQLEFIDTESLFSTWIAKDRNGDIYTRSSTGLHKLVDGSLQKIGDPPTYPHQEAFIDTPFGYFYRARDCSIYRSYGLVLWDLIFTPVDPSESKNSLQNSFPWKYDEVTGKGYLFIGEYIASDGRDIRHKVYRITVNPDHTYTSDIVLEFYSRNENTADNTKVPSCEHVHMVVVDEYTKDVWVGVGDGTDSGMYYSHDNGENWNAFAIGSQDYRGLSMWFTQEYIYWNMDSESPQHIYRIHRSNISDISKKEIVAKLDNGSMWYHLWAKDADGKDFVIMAASAEGQIRDWLARMYGIWELDDGTNVVQELVCIPSNTPNEYTRFVQLEPKVQRDDGIVYLKTRNIEPSGYWKMEVVKTPIDNKALVTKMYKHFRAKFVV